MTKKKPKRWRSQRKRTKRRPRTYHRISQSLLPWDILVVGKNVICATKVADTASVVATSPHKHYFLWCIVGIVLRSNNEKRLFRRDHIFDRNFPLRVEFEPRRDGGGQLTTIVFVAPRNDSVATCGIVSNGTGWEEEREM